MNHKSIYHRLLLLMLVLAPLQIFARTIPERINDAFMPVAIAWEDLVFTSIPIFGMSVPIVLIILIGGALFFTIYFRFINVRRFGTALHVVRGGYDHLEDKSILGEVNHFQALATAVSGTVGLGNIAMVAVAISLGGPGATFWMILGGLLGMSSKFVECTLGVKYRISRLDGTVSGGPMYYLSQGLSDQGRAQLGKILSILFAVLCVGASFGGGNAFQANQATAQLVQQLGLSGSSSFYIGCIMAIIVGIVIIGGIRRIAQVTEKVVPLMAVLYVVSAIIILCIQWERIDDAIGLILSEAFTPRATVTGGIIGVMVQGFRRAAFSNEAGAGSAAIAHSAVKTGYPVTEGLVALLEPFIDTVVICTLTALVIITFNMDGAFVYGLTENDQIQIVATGEYLGGVNLTSMAFEHTIPGFSIALAVAVVLFAFSTMLAWSYYGQQSWDYLFKNDKRASLIYKILFLLFTILGASVTMEAVIKFSEAMILALVFPNMIGLILLRKSVKKELLRFLEAIKRP